jgi:hypothetical protein
MISTKGVIAPLMSGLKNVPRDSLLGPKNSPVPAHHATLQYVYQPNPTVWTVTGGRLLGESPPAAFPFDGSESTRAISTVSPSGLPRNSQSRVTPGNLRTIRSAISLLSGAPHSTLFHLPRSIPRNSANASWHRAH